MDHQSFRFYIPGIIFLFPIYAASCWIITNYYNNVDLRQFVLIGGITVFPAIALPVGWFIYNIYRVIWLRLTHGGYENKEFNKLVCQNTKPFYCPLFNKVLMDFSKIIKNSSWIKFDIDTFRHTFYPYMSKRRFLKEIYKIGFSLKFTEHLSDHVLFEDKSYDYARSISSVRYGLESAVFALILGVIYSISIYIVWLHLLSNHFSFFQYIISLSLIIIISSALLAILIIRWFYASKEYDARLNLISIISTNNEFDIKANDKNIPIALLNIIESINFRTTDYAAFDLDNTLLLGDIGDAVFAELLKRNQIKNFTWTDYLKLLELDRKKAYEKVIEIMIGFKTEEIERITLDIIQSEENYIDIDGFKVPIPKPNLIMQAIINYLHSKNIQINIITTSNQISAQLICWYYFGISNSNVFGGKVKVNWNGKIKALSEEIPFANEKVNTLKRIKDNRPIITGGDGVWDRYLLDYTDSKGIRLWLGKDDEEYFKLKNEYFQDLAFFQVLEEIKTTDNSTYAQ